MTDDPDPSPLELAYLAGWEEGFAAAARPTIGHYQRARPNPNHPDPQHEIRRHLLAEAHALIHALNARHRLDQLLPRLHHLIATAHGAPSPLLTTVEPLPDPPRTDHPTPAQQATTASSRPL